MADPGCSGTQPFKTLVNHHDHERTLPPSLATRPNNAPNTFRGANTNSPDHGRFTSFMGGGDLSSAPMPTLATTPTVASNMTGPITGRHPFFPPSQHPYTPQAHSHPPQQGWAQEYIRQSSIGPAIQNDRTSHKPGITSTNRSIQFPSPGLVNNSYNGAQLPYSSLGFPVAEQAAGAHGHGAEINEWMGEHRPSGVALDDVDQVLNQISGELEDLVVETGPEGVSHSAAEQARGSQSPSETQPAEATESESVRSRPDQPTAVSHLARKILQAVDHEDDEKWKDSSFLELMRDFRDGKKDVSENTIEVVTTA